MPKVFSKLLSFASCLLPSSQKGQSTVYIIIVIIVIIFAVMLAGGGGSLFTGNEPSSVTDGPTPSGASNSSALTPTPDANWSVEVVEGTCQAGKSAYKQEDVTAKGSGSGYISLEIENPVGTWKTDVAISFTSPTETYTVKLDNATGYNTKNWRLRLFSGGSDTGGTWSGGGEKAVSKLGSPTGC